MNDRTAFVELNCANHMLVTTEHPVRSRIDCSMTDFSLEIVNIGCHTRSPVYVYDNYIGTLA